MGNLDLWNAVADIDPDFTKPITGKDYRGTSPNPHYLIKLATEKLGPAGQGFGWEVIAEGFEHMGDTVLHWCRIEFWWREGGVGGAVGGFESYGQTKAAYTTSKGQHRVDEDAPKKSMTDALTKALAQIGFGANIFLGRWDDSKYVDHVRENYRSREGAEEREAFVARCVEAARQTQNMSSVEELEAAYKALRASEPLIAKDGDVLKAYGERKQVLKAEEAAAREAAE